MQDDYAHEKRISGDRAQVTIPASVVDWLRNAAYAEIGSAAQALDTAAFASDRERHQEWFRAPAESLRETYALLDAIGWSRTIPPAAVQIHLGEDCWALMRAVEAALEFADEDASEAVHSNAEHGGTSMHDVEVKRAGVLWDFMAAAQARIDALAVEEGAGAFLDIAA